MQIINITNDLDELFFAKKAIEDDLTKQNKKETKMSLSEFIEWLNMSEKIYVYDDTTIIPFNNVFTETEQYFFTVENDKSKINKCIEELVAIEYNTSNLIEVPITDIYEGELVGKNYFVINGNYFINKKNYSKTK